MKLKCSACGQEVMAIVQKSFEDPQVLLYFFPYHGVARDYNYNLGLFRTNYITCNKSLMKAVPTEIVSEI